MSPRLFWSITTMQARKMMSYRADFWISALFGFAIQMGVVYFLWDAMFRESGQERIGGYTFRPMLMYYVMVLLISKVVNVRMGDGMVAADIYDGGLSRYIVYPTNYFLFKFARASGTSCRRWSRSRFSGRSARFFSARRNSISTPLA